MPLFNDILKFTLNGVAAGEYWQNDYFYRVLADELVWSADVPFSTVCEGWFDAVMSTYFAADILDRFHLSTAFEGCKGENLFQIDEIGGYNPAAAIVGTATGNVEPPNVTYSLTQPTNRRGMNSGQRGLSGVPTSALGTGAEIVVGFREDLQTMAARMSTDIFLDFGSDDPPWAMTLRPVIVKRVRVGTPPNAKYPLPTSQEEAITYTASNWTLSLYTSTRNTRKRGRGM